MKLMKSGIEIDAGQQEKIKGGYCVCYCDIGYITLGSERVGVAGNICACTCSTEVISEVSNHMSQY